MSNLQPKDLTTEILQSFLEQGKSREWIMAEYSFKSIGYFYTKSQRLGCEPAKGQPIRGQSGGALYPPERDQVDELNNSGMSCHEIAQALDLKYQQVYRRVFREKLAQYEKDYKAGNYPQTRKPRAKKPSKYAGQITTSTSRYIEAGKELPPINPPGPITHIHAGCECVESGLIAKWGNKLSPVTAKLAERKPVMMFTSQDRLS